VQALKNRRRLEKGEVQLCVGNGSNVSVVVMGTIELNLPSGFILELDDAYFVPSITRNIISISYLDLESYHFVIKDKYYFLYRNDVCFYCGHLMNGCYVLENDKHILSVENDKKRRKISHESSTFM
jgi:hypothetical protein